ncbi:uncharacterized protein SOCEGT47_051590 [Sorangium cellulosum]|uniref:RNA polymerase sigma-70 region 2 domain-containing protein n=2 Tax=Sorangium cellulosum TaxID=56 RepID=A0A4P2Q5F4_SORCE|nr:uncharacterized protein SOCEGT47_051590 [Sorangium cellulosum]
MPTDDSPRASNPLADSTLRRALVEFVRRRVPSAEVDDVVQTVLCDALASPARPSDPAELRRWLLGIARHKAADHHRRASRETAVELPDVPTGPPPVEARELARWAEEQASATREARQTLSWMAREGEGEKLESIAAEAQMPAARVRQRVSRMRRWMRERWRAELAAVAALALLVLLVARLLRAPGEPVEIAPLPEPAPTAPLEQEPPRDALERARALRVDALRACDEAAWRRCLDRLDEAARLDAAGDGAPDIAAARARAQEALQTPPGPESPAPRPETPAPGPETSAPGPKAPAPTPKTRAPVLRERSNVSPRSGPTPEASPRPAPKAEPPRKPTAQPEALKRLPTKEGKTAPRMEAPWLEPKKGATQK